MMTWLLSLLGVGGLGAAALIFIPGAAAKAGEIGLVVLKAAKEDPWQFACAALAFVAFLGWNGQASLKRDVAAEHHKRIVAEQATRLLAESYVKAQADAKAAQDVQDRTIADLSNRLAGGARDALVQAERGRSAAVADYVRTHGLRACPAQGSGSGASGAGLPVDPQGTAGADTPAGMVAITPADLDRLSKGAVQGSVCTGFLRSLVEAKLAVPVVKP